ncbi:hypothetical protein BLOT_008945 [Blomia tropicalis]|nr:hypothetical protein BLOT_008945 [Blomia tropicalis]
MEIGSKDRGHLEWFGEKLMKILDVNSQQKFKTVTLSNELKSCNRRIALEEMQRELQNDRNVKTICQITKKMDNLRQNYKKNRLASTGGEPTNWRFFMLCINCLPPIISIILIPLISAILLTKFILFENLKHKNHIARYEKGNIKLIEKWPSNKRKHNLVTHVVI